MNNNLYINDKPELLLQSTFRLIVPTRPLVAKTINQELTLWNWEIEKTSMMDPTKKSTPFH